MNRWTVIGALALLTLLAYGGVLHAGFVYEDAHWMPTLTPVLQAGASAVVYAPWAFAEWLSGGDPWSYHAVVLGVHVLNGLLLFSLMRTLTHDDRPALITLALFWLHPINMEAVAYVTGGRETFALFWLLLSIRVGVGKGYLIWRALALLGCLAVAVSAKPSAVVAVVLVPMALVILERDRFVSWAWTPWIVGLGVVLAVTGISQVLLTNRQEGIVYIGLTGWHRYAAVTSAALLRYLSLIVWPVGFSVDHDWRAVSGIWTTISGIGVSSAALLAWTIRKTLPIYAVTVLWMLVALAPRFIIQQEEVLNEHQMLIPLIAVWVSLGILLDHLWWWVDQCEESFQERPYAAEQV